MMTNVVNQCCWFLLQKLCLKTQFQVIIVYLDDVLFRTIIVRNSISSKWSPSHRKLKKSIEEMGTDFLLLPNASTQVTLECQKWQVDTN